MNVKKTAPQARGRRFYHVFEVAKSVYKYTPNKFSFRAHPKNFVILRVSKDLVETKRQTFSAPVPQLLIINFTAKTASIRVWVSPPQSNHQADNLAKLRQEFLFLRELIAKIFGAVRRKKSLMRLSALLAFKQCRCRDDGFCSCYLVRFEKTR